MNTPSQNTHHHRLAVDSLVFPGAKRPAPPPRKRAEYVTLETTSAFRPPPKPLPAQHPDAPIEPHILDKLTQDNPLYTTYADHTYADRTDDPIHNQNQAKIHARRVLGIIFHEPEHTLEDLTPYRVRTAWRLVREMARHRGFISPGDMLIEGLEPAWNPRNLPSLPEASSQPEETLEGAEAPDLPPPPEPQPAITGLVADRWLYPERYVKPVYDNKNPHMRLFMSVVESMLDAEDINPVYCPFQWLATQIPISAEEMALNPETNKRHHVDTTTLETVWSVHHHPGIALLPPGIPYPQLNKDPDTDGDTAQDYDPKNPLHDPALHGYIRTLKLLASCLYIDLGAKDDPDSGRYGLAGLFDPMTVRGAFPSRIQIMTWEQLLVEEVLDLVVKEGLPKAKTILKDKYGFQDIEIQQLFKMAKAKAAHIAASDAEEDRGLMILRLEDAARRAREALDIRAELAALKNLAIVQGLARVDPQDAMSDFINIVRNVGERRQVANDAMPELPGDDV